MREATLDSPWSHPKHARSGPDPNPRRSRRSVALIGIVLAIVAVVVGAVAWTQVDEIWDRYWLEHHGRLGEATVVRVYTDGSDGGIKTYAVVAVPGCSCVAHVHVGTDAHPEGSTLAVWYDPNDETHAVTAEDIGDDAYSLVIFSVLGFIAFLGALVWGQRKGNNWGAEARTLGLTYQRIIEPFDESTAPRSLGLSARTYRYGLAGRRHGADVDCRTCIATRGSGDRAKLTKAFAVTFMSDPPLPDIWIGSLKQSRELDPAGLGPVVAPRGRALPKGLVVRCDARSFAAAVIESRVPQTLMQSPEASLEIHGGRLFLFPGRIKPPQLDGQILRALRVERDLQMLTVAAPRAACSA